MSKLTYTRLSEACSPGGATALSLVTELTPAGGPHVGVAPARYVGADDLPMFAYETRFVDGRAAVTVIIDQRQSQLNRVEAAILQSIRDGDPVLGRVPRIEVAYDGGRVVYTDLELPQRVFDAHIRSGTIEGRPVAAHPAYLAARDSSPANVRAVLELSPGSLVFGSWDSTRKAPQGRYRSALVGEIIGVLADQRDGAPRESSRGAARIDPVGDDFEPTGHQLHKILAGERDELRADLIQEVEDSAKAAKGAKGTKGKTAAAGPALGFGDIRPILQDRGVVGCSRIIRTQVLSFAALRQLRFDAGPAGDASCRTLLAAYALAGLARSNAELTIRANCDLVEAGPTTVRLDGRNGVFTVLDAPSIEEADALLESALAEAKLEADIHWKGQIFRVAGNPTVYAAATATATERSGGDAAGQKPRPFRPRNPATGAPHEGW